MSMLEGSVVLKNKFGKTVQGPTLSISPEGMPLIQEVSLTDNESSPSAEYDFPSQKSVKWKVSFTPDGGKEKGGSVVCDLSTEDNNKTTVVTLNPTGFTVAPPKGASVTGSYD